MTASLESILHDRTTPSAAICAQQFHRQLVDALRALQLMQNHAKAEPHPLTEIDALLQALDRGGIHITCGELRAMVFKQPPTESSCKRR
jgi:hypothetical protein